MRLTRRTLAWKKGLDRDLRDWQGESSSFSSFVGRLLSRALREGLQLEGLEIEHAKGGGVSRVFVGDDARPVTHEARGEAFEGKHVFDPSRCGACRALRESFGGRL